MESHRKYDEFDNSEDAVRPCMHCRKEVKKVDAYKGLFCSEECENKEGEAIRGLTSKELHVNPRRG